MGTNPRRDYNRPPEIGAPMKTIVRKFFDEPVFALALLQAAAVVLVSEGVVAGWVGLLIVAVVTAAQRGLVRPDKVGPA